MSIVTMSIGALQARLVSSPLPESISITIKRPRYGALLRGLSQQQVNGTTECPRASTASAVLRPAQTLGLRLG